MSRSLLLVFLGGGLGAAARHLVNLGAGRLLGLGFPFGTLIVNVLGSALMGVIVIGAALRWQLPQEARLFLTTGVLGGFTTFSAFSLDVMILWERDRHDLALLYVAASLLLSLAAIALAMYGMRRALA
ncbi:fluoride efflux transporter CrcB [Geminicoccus flavidas]|uniref:fluoride efflux transporter CrcB n=1 Tax=Geminicoccus flavidas TaxID=2506407 RepID=UPI001358BEE9|nr:fluoride efflux transporter CrcB [Geminicoccus flavidas]